MASSVLALEDCQTGLDLHEPGQRTHFLDFGEHEIDAFLAQVEFPVASRAFRGQFDLVEDLLEQFDPLPCLIPWEFLDRDGPPARMRSSIDSGRAFLGRWLAFRRRRAGAGRISSTNWMAR